MISFKSIIFILAMLIYGIMFVVKKLQEQAAIKRAKDDQAKRKLDELRTGRNEVPAAPTVLVSTSGGGSPGPLSHQEATKRLQELAERRREQLEELRRRAAAQGKPISSQPPAPVTQQIKSSAQPQPHARPATPRPVPRRTAPAPARRPGTRPQAPKQARQAPPSNAPVSTRRAGTPSGRPVEQVDKTEQLARREALRAAEERTPKAAQPAPAVPARGGIAKIHVPMGRANAAELRRIMILSELLSPPKAIRGDAYDVI